MNKIISNKNIFLVLGVVFILIFMCASISNAIILSQNVVEEARFGHESQWYQGSVYHEPVQSTQSMNIPVFLPSNSPMPNLDPGTGALLDHTYLIDNFEYWETPQNHGWTIYHPGMPGGYPLWGIGLGIGSMETVMDFQEGSRTLEAYMPATVFVPGIETFKIQNVLPGLVPLPVISLKMRAPVSIEMFDTYQVIALCQMTEVGTTNSGLVEVHLVPRAKNDAGNSPIEDKYEDSATLFSGLDSINEGSPVIRVDVGREMSDGSWHLIMVDLDESIRVATNGAYSFDGVGSIILSGNQYRADDIQLRTKAMAFRRTLHPFLFHPGHIYTQLYDPVGTTRYIFACDIVADHMLPTTTNVETEIVGRCGCQFPLNYGNTAVQSMITGQDISEINSKLWIDYMFQGVIDQGYAIEPTLTADQYQAAIEALTINLAEVRVTNPMTPISIGIGVGLVNIDIPAAYLYAIDIPNLIDPTMAYGPVGADGGVNMIKFDAWIGGPHDEGTCTGLVSNVPLIGAPQPRYYPLYLQQSLLNDGCCGKCYLSDFEIETTRLALLQAGYTHWPTVAALRIPPEQIVENLVVSVTASNGFSEDLDTLMVRTVNYAMTNYPPIIQDPDVSALFNVGETVEYFICATDPDSHTLDSIHFDENGNPGFGDDMAQLIYSATLNGLPSYMYGPWTESIIDQKTGTISFETQFEGEYKCNVVVRDPKGAEAVVSFPIFVIQSGTWLNHPPILVDGWDYPMSAKAGENITWRFGDVVDPDGESLSYSCNIGAIGLVGGEQMWQFQTMYPGNYLLEIVAYDTRGGYIVMTQDVIITPWWSN